MSEGNVCTHSPMTQSDVSEMVKGIFDGTYVPPTNPPSACKPNKPAASDSDYDYEAVTPKIVEVRTVNSSTRFHVPNEKVTLERELLDIAQQERKVQGIRVHFPSSRRR